MATLAELQTELSELKAARSRAANGQSYRDAAGNQVTRGDLATLDRMITELELRVAIVAGGGVLSHGQAVFRGTR